MRVLNTAFVFCELISRRRDQNNGGEKEGSICSNREEGEVEE